MTGKEGWKSLDSQLSMAMVTLELSLGMVFLSSNGPGSSQSGGCSSLSGL